MPESCPFLRCLMLMGVAAIVFVLPPVSPAAEVAALRDPTLPPPVQAGPAPKDGGDPAASWKLNATLVGSGRAVAVINNRLVEIGDLVDGARVVAIQPNQVRLRRGSSVWVLRGTSSDVKKIHRQEVTSLKRDQSR